MIGSGPALRIVAWNIRAGGGVRVEGIAAQLARWAPDIVALSEFRGTDPSRRLARMLREFGWTHQRATAADGHSNARRENALLIASRWPLRLVRLRHEPGEPRRWLAVHVTVPTTRGGPLTLGALHSPIGVTGRKAPFLDAMLMLARCWRGGPALMIGDTNTGRPQIDEESAVFSERHAKWMESLHAVWPDAHRLRHGDDARAFTWYSPNAGNGFRLDEAFLHPSLAARLGDVRHAWGGDGAERRDALSDHAALILDFAAQ